ncbi:helix-turn-helix domain-containing protein [Sporichthya polymorpha]|uniref:helix-turn-helix domain-containing protein n=1 Tax=Sporichthya polymorpha TaxID=35751 RepID=UPI00035F7C71|nr:helix-turn-helix domain-containing protein [Sporichthya polymorpha]
MEVSVGEAAVRLGVSGRRVRERIASGDLRARRIGRAWVVDEAQLGRSPRVGRPMSRRVAWAFLDLLAGGVGEGVSQPEQSRLRKKRSLLLEASDPASLLRSWLPARAEVRRYSAADADLPALREDARIALSGVSDMRSGMAAAGVVEGYVGDDEVDNLVADFLLSERGEPNVILHVLQEDRPVAAPVPLPLLLADLADHDGPRERAAVARLLRDLP